MAVKTFTGTGLASDTALWSDTSLPVSGDSVVISSGSTCTLDGDYIWGDGSLSTVEAENAVVVYGSLVGSTTTPWSLKCIGALRTAAGGVTNFDQTGTGNTGTLILTVGASIDFNTSGTSHSGYINYSALSSAVVSALGSVPADVWAYSSRTLTTGTDLTPVLTAIGSLPADVWANTERTLTTGTDLTPVLTAIDALPTTDETTQLIQTSNYINNASNTGSGTTVQTTSPFTTVRN
jgi:hypothetical protein